jgi:hypothetical protein
MTSCISQLWFSFHRHRPIRADFSGGQISSDAGLLPLRAFDQRYGLTGGLAERVPDSRSRRTESQQIKSSRLLAARTTLQQRRATGFARQRNRTLEAADRHCKSAKLERQIEQLELRLDELEATQAKQAAPSQTPAAPLVNAAKPARRPLPEHLPGETQKYPPKQIACPDRGGELKHIGEDVSEILKYVPAQFKLIRQVRPKLAGACCERIVQAEAPSHPIIERGVAADCLYL